MTNNIASVLIKPVRDTTNALQQGIRDGRLSAAPRDAVASSFKDILQPGIRMDATDMRASMAIPHAAAEYRTQPEIDTSSRRASDQDDTSASDTDPADHRSESTAADDLPDHATREPAESETVSTNAAATGNSHVPDPVGVVEVAFTGDADGSPTDAGGKPISGVTGAPPSTGADGDPEATDSKTALNGNAAGRHDIGQAPGNRNPGIAADPASGSASIGADVSSGAGMAARQAKELAKSLPAGEDVKINVTVSKAGDSLLSQPASSLAVASVAGIQKKGALPGQPPVGASAKAGYPAPSAASQPSPDTQPAIRGQGEAGAASLEPPTGAQVNQSQLGAAPPTAAAPSLGTQPGPFADLTVVGPSGPMTAGQRTGAGQVATAVQPQSAQPPVAEQISVQIAKAVRAGVDQIDIQLRPKELGRVDVRLELGSDGRVSATISVDNRETLDLLKTDAHGLEKALDDAGLKVDSNSLNFNLRGQDSRSSSDQPSRMSSPPGPRDGGDGDIEAQIGPRTLGDYSRGGVSTDGHINIET